MTNNEPVYKNILCMIDNDPNIKDYSNLYFEDLN